MNSVERKEQKGHPSTIYKSRSVMTMSMSSPKQIIRVNHLVIGAGVVGLAIAELLARTSTQSTFLIERLRSFGMETSSRNSEVIHGINGTETTDPSQADFIILQIPLKLNYAFEVVDYSTIIVPVMGLSMQKLENGLSLLVKLKIRFWTRFTSVPNHWACRHIFCHPQTHLNWSPM